MQDVVLDGDMVEFELVRATRQTLTMTMRIECTVTEEPVGVIITFQPLPEGLNYPAREVVEAPLGKGRW